MEQDRSEVVLPQGLRVWPGSGVLSKEDPEVYVGRGERPDKAGPGYMVVYRSCDLGNWALSRDTGYVGSWPCLEIATLAAAGGCGTSLVERGRCSAMGPARHSQGLGSVSHGVSTHSGPLAAFLGSASLASE